MTPNRISRRAALGALSASLLLAVGGCGSDATTSGASSTSTTSGTPTATSTTTGMPSMSGMSPSSAMSGMSASSSTSASMSMETDGGPAPAGIKTASNPKYPVGTKVTLLADHMSGMKGATATVVGAYSTYTYAVDYTPTTGGAMVKDHKWVVQQEIKDAGTARLANGTQVVLTASHMTGMYGAKATIVSSTDETVYMVDYQANGMTIKNHKWVVESEMESA